MISTVDFEVFGPNFQVIEHGGISLERLPAGLYRIREFIPAGYGDPSAFCGIGDTDGFLPTYSKVVVYDGSYEFELGPSQTIYCDWFNIAAQAPGDTATLYVNKHFCPPAAEFDAEAAIIYDLAANCQEPTTPVPFSIIQNGVRIAGGTAIGAPDALIFNGLPVGTVAIVEELPDGFGQPLVFCSVGDEFGNDRAPVTEAPVDNDRITWSLNAGDVVFCDWFNIPSPLGTTISVVKSTCPKTVGPDSGTFDEYAGACLDPTADVSFKLDGARTGNPGEQVTDANGQITWAEMEADHYSITEEVPTGYETPAVFCAFYDPAAFGSRRYERSSVSAENRIKVDLADGEVIACSWFNIPVRVETPTPGATPDSTPPTSGAQTPAPTTRPPAVATPSSATGRPATASPGSATIRPGTTTATATQPAAGGTSSSTSGATLVIRYFRYETFYDFIADDADPVADCTLRPEGTSFVLEGGVGTATDTPRRTAGIGPGSGQATFTGIAPGDYHLAEAEFRIGDAAFIMSCDSDRRDFGDYPFTPFANAAADGSVRLTIVEDETLTCDWYDVRAEGTGQG